MKYAVTVFTIIMAQTLSVIYFYKELGDGYAFVLFLGTLVADIAVGLTFFNSSHIKKILTQPKG